MYLEIDEILKKLIIEKTNTDYDFKGNLVTGINANLIIRDLLGIIDNLEEEFEDYKKRDEDSRTWEDEIRDINYMMNQDRLGSVR